MHAIGLWPNRHDYAKLILITLALILFMLILVAAVVTNIECGPLPVVGMGICAVGASWLGNWKWIPVPPLAVLVAFAILVPAVGYNPALSGGDSGLIAEIPFWFGVPALIGANVGYAFNRTGGLKRFSQSNNTRCR